MVVKLSTYNKASEVELQIFSNINQSIQIVGYDDKKQRYFDRNVRLNQPKTTLRFGCPITPEKLFVKINSNNYQNLKVVPNLNRLGSSFFLNKKTKEFISFAQEFCTNYWKYKPQKNYYSSDRNFHIAHYNLIGKDTPARIHKTKHFIEVGSDFFSRMTIPMRVFVLCHEYAHIYMNEDPKSEFEADINGAKLYLKLNYPIIELLYSFTKIFGDNEQSIMRAKAITKFVENYD